MSPVAQRSFLFGAYFLTSLRPTRSGVAETSRTAQAFTLQRTHH
jgi:hypothetical protein